MGNRPTNSALWVCLSALSVLAGCEMRGLEPIEGRIIFKVYEDYQKPYCDCEPGILLFIQTEKIYGCSNYLVKADVSRSGGLITVRLLGIQAPEICLTALGPATRREFISLPEGSYQLNFIKDYATDRYFLNIKPNLIQIVSFVPLTSRPEFTHFWRYPKNSFAYLCGTMAETAWVYEDFLSRLLREIDLEEFHFPEFGEIGYPRSSQGHHNDMPAKYFIYKTEADFDKAGEILKSYTEAVLSSYQGTAIWLTNWKDKSYMSWLF